MLDSIKAEFKKVRTIRSTYFLLGFALLLVIFFAFYVEGLKAGLAPVATDKLAGVVTSTVAVVSIFITFIGVFLVTHEYRYNTINYTLTLARNRTRVLLAKIFVISVIAVVSAIVFGALAPILTDLGIKAAGHTLPPQNFHVFDLFWRAVFFVWAWCMLTLMMSVLIRIQTAVIAAIFILPGTIESLIGLLIKDNVVYLPFSALQSVVQTNTTQPISYQRAALVTIVYVVVGWIITWQVFLHRDAN